MPYSYNNLNVSSDIPSYTIGANLGAGRAIVKSNYSVDSVSNILVTGGNYASKNYIVNPSADPELLPYVCVSNTVLENEPVVPLWSDGSAIWQKGFIENNISDISLNFNKNGTSQKFIGSVNALAIDNTVSTTNGVVTTKGTIYAGGTYSSNAYKGNMLPYVASSADQGVTWTNGKKLAFSNAFDNDISYNCINNINLVGPEVQQVASVQSINGSVNALSYDICGNNIYAGGYYTSKGSSSAVTVPFIAYSADAGTTWVDASSINQTTSLFADLKTSTASISSVLSGIPSTVRPFAGSVNAMTHDFSNNIIFAGGNYSRQVDGSFYKTYPFVTMHGKSQAWQDGSAIWQRAFDNDLSLNVANGGGLFYNAAQNINNYSDTTTNIVSPFVGAVYAMTYDPINQEVYAGGCYASTSNNGKLMPFVCHTSDNGLTWKDASGIWQNTKDGTNVLTYDMSKNITRTPCGVVYSLSYDSTYNRVYAGGSYFSINKDTTIPFILETTTTGQSWTSTNNEWKSFPNSGQVLAMTSNPVFTGNLLNTQNRSKSAPMTGMWLDSGISPTIAQQVANIAIVEDTFNPIIPPATIESGVETPILNLIAGNGALKDIRLTDISFGGTLNSASSITQIAIYGSSIFSSSFNSYTLLGLITNPSSTFSNITFTSSPTILSENIYYLRVTVTLNKPIVTGRILSFRGAIPLRYRTTSAKPQNLIVPYKPHDAVSDLQAQLAALNALVAKLQGKTSTASPPTLYDFTRNLIIGSTGEDVSALQTILNSYGYTIPKVTGYFGTQTQNALKAFQAKNKITTNNNGNFGAATRVIFNSGTFIANDGTRVTLTTPGTVGTVGTTPGTVGTVGTVGTTFTNTLSLSLSSTTPAVPGLIVGGTINNVLSVDIRTSGNTIGTITSLTFQKTGISSNSAVQDCYLFIGNDRITDAFQLNSTGQLIFNNMNINIPFGTPISISLYITLSTTASTGSIISFTCNAYNGISISDITGNAFSVGIPNPPVSSYTITNSVSSVEGRINLGTLQTSIFNAQIAATQRETFISSIQFILLGTTQYNSFANITLYINNNRVSATLVRANANATYIFNITPSIRVPVGNSTLEIRADIVDGISSNFYIQLFNIVATDSLYGMRIYPTYPNNTKYIVGQSYSIGGSGILSAVINSSFASSAIFPGTRNVKVASFKLSTVGEPIKCNSLSFSLSSSNFSNFSFFYNGLQIGSPQTPFSTTLTFAMGDFLTVRLNQTSIIEIYADAIISASGSFLMTLVSISSVGQYTGTAISLPASVSGQNITITTSTFSVNKNINQPEQLIVLPTSTNNKVMRFDINNSSGNTDVTITSMTFLINAPATNLSSIQLINSGGVNLSTFVFPASGRIQLTSFLSAITIPRGVSSTFYLQADVSGTNGDSFIISLTNLQGDSTGMNMNVLPLIAPSNQAPVLIQFPNDSSIYLVDNGKRYLFSTAAIFTSWNYSFASVVTGTAAQSVLPFSSISIPLRVSPYTYPIDQINSIIINGSNILIKSSADNFFINGLTVQFNSSSYTSPITPTINFSLS